MAQNRLQKTLRHLSYHPSHDFKYTSSEKCILSNAQREQFEAEGYLIVRKLLDESDTEKYRQRFVEISEGKVEADPTMIVMRDVKVAHKKELGEHAITKIQDFQNDEVLFDYCQHPKIVSHVQSIIGTSIKSVHSMLINKPPDPGSKSSRHPLHQDLYYFPFRPASKIVCSWTAMQHVDRSNGCLVLYPGSHKSELLAHGYPQWEGGVNKMYHGILNVPNTYPKIYAEMDVGDTIFFHPLVIHGSGTNRTNGFRKAISCHYANENCHYIDVKGTVQEDIAKEVKSIMDRKIGASDLDFIDIWKFKSRSISST